MKTPPFKIANNGDSALTIIFDFEIGEVLSRKIQYLGQLLKREFPTNLIEVIPGYNSLTVCFVLSKFERQSLTSKIKSLISKTTQTSDYQSKLIEIPVCYGGEFGTDIDRLSKYCDLSLNQIIKLHSGPTYLVHMLGFLPGFLYLGGMANELYCPRKSNPALKVIAGSVAIGGMQTGIYPIQSPGGWNIIGRTPSNIFDSARNQPAVAAPLDKIKFIPILEDEFLDISLLTTLT